MINSTSRSFIQESLTKATDGELIREFHRRSAGSIAILVQATEFDSCVVKFHPEDTPKGALNGVLRGVCQILDNPNILTKFEAEGV